MLQWNYYTPTELEKRTTILYQSIGIQSPQDLEPDVIAERLGVKLRYEDTPSLFYEYGNYRCIVIDKTLSPDEQRRQFFHELGHLFRGHAGEQSELPDLFRGLQEEQAEHFARYAMMPYFMIQSLTLPEFEWEMPYLITSEFRVPLHLARERWEQIKRRISAGRWEQACIEYERSRYRKTSPANWCPEAKKMFRLAIAGKMKKGQGVVIR